MTQPLFSEFNHEYFSIPVVNAQAEMPVLQLNTKENQKKNGIIIVIQEIFGINESLKETCAQYANQGYTVLCPDLFHRFQHGISLTDQTEGDLKQAFEYFGTFDVQAGIQDIANVIDYARQTFKEMPVGAVGYCLGGFLAYLTACQTQIDATVSYYGVNIQTALDEASAIKKPLLLHIAANDEFVPPQAQEAIIQHFRDINLVTCCKYNDVQHAFARVDGVHYSKDTAIQANQETYKFFAQNL